MNSNMQFGLKVETINKLNNVFKEYPQVERVVLYGSRAKGNFNQGSDIDLTIIGNNINLSILHKIENQIDDLLLPYTLDISLFEHINNDELLDHINIIGINFYVK